jgi:hypothetical protein
MKYRKPRHRSRREHSIGDPNTWDKKLDIWSRELMGCFLRIPRAGHGAQSDYS